MSEQKKWVRVHIVNSGQPGYMTQVTDAETGKELEWGIFRITLDAKYKEPPTAFISVYMPAVDIIADAEIRHVCPVCGRAIEEEPD